MVLLYMSNHWLFIKFSTAAAIYSDFVSVSNTTEAKKLNKPEGIKKMLCTNATHKLGPLELNMIDIH